MKKGVIVSYLPFIINIDDEILKKYLLAAGIEIDNVSWDDKEYNWKQCDFIMIRSTWNSYRMLDKFKKWLEYIESNNIKVLNDISIIKNNIFKERQINWFKKNNIPIMKCEVFSNSEFEFMKKPEKTLIDTILKYFGPNKKMYILKPSVSAMAYDTYIIDPFNINKDKTYKVYKNYEKLFARLLNKYKDRGIIVQEFSQSIKNGEYGLVFLNGKYVVGSKKIYGVEYGKNLVDISYDNSEMIKFAQGIINKLPVEKVPFARVDIIEDSGEFKIMELELADADLYLRKMDGFDFWIDDEEQCIKESYEKGIYSNELVEFTKYLVKENCSDEKN